MSADELKKRIIFEGAQHLKSFNSKPKHLELLNRKKLWYPHHKQLKKVLAHYEKFTSQMDKLNLDIEEKILTGSLNKHANKDGIIFWDVFNLMKG